MANLTDADKVLRNDTGKDIASKLDAIKSAIQNQSTTLNNLSDVSILSVQDGQFLKYNSTEQKWENVSLPDPMVFKGTLGTGGTITALPVDGSANVGDTYKVIEDGTYATVSAKVGDLFSCLTKTIVANTWVLIPSGDESFTDTWRGIKVNGTEKLASSISSGEVDFIEGSNVQITFDTTGNKIIISATDTTYSEATQSTSGLMSASDKTKLDTMPTTADTQPITTGSAVNTKEYIDDKTTLVKSASGDLIHITDGGDNIPLKSCEIDIESIQDLHSYDEPWPAGGGKNKLPLVLANIKTANTSGTWSGNTYTVDSAIFTVNTDNDNNVISIVGKGNGSSQNYISLTFTLKSGSYILTSDFTESLGVYDTFLLSGGSTIARGNSTNPGQSFTLNSDSSVEWRFRVQNNSNYTCTPMIRLSTETSETFEPYSNICSISGFDSGVVSVCGKNFLEPTLVNTTTVNGITFTVLSDGTIRANGTATNTATLMINNITGGGNLLDNLLPLNNVACIGSGCPSVAGCRIAFARMDGSSFNDDTGSGVSFTVGNLTPSTNAYVRLQVLSGYTVNNVIFKPMIRLASVVDDTYEPYTSNTYTFTFGQTVYGGHFDNKGNLVVTHGYIASYNGETINEPWVSSMDNYVPNTSPSTGAQVVYPLTTPITMVITSQDIHTLSGVNNIFSNCGDTAIEYFTSSADGIAELIKASTWTEITGTLTAGNTSITLSSGDITSNSTINVFTDGGVDYTSITVANGSVTLTFEESSSDLGVKVRVS